VDRTGGKRRGGEEWKDKGKDGEKLEDVDIGCNLGCLLKLWSSCAEY